MPRFRRRARRKRRYAWTGAYFDLVTQTSDTTALEIIGPPTDNLVGTNIDCVVERVIFGFQVENTQVLITARFQAYLAVLETTNALQPLAYIPNFLDQEMYAKRDNMWLGCWWLGDQDTLSGSVGTSGPASTNGSMGVTLVNNGLPLDIGVKRKMRGSEGLYFVCNLNADPATEPGAQGVLRAWFRVLLSFGRK